MCGIFCITKEIKKVRVSTNMLQKNENGNEKAKESLKRLGANWIVNGKIEDDVDDGDIDTNNISADNRFLF